MTAPSNGRARPVEIPDRPSGDPNAQAPAHAYAREGSPVTARELPVKVRRWSIQAVLTGGSVVHAPGLSLAQTWTRHAQAASHYKTAWARWPRYVWGGLHTALTAVLRTVEWVTDSPPKLLTAAAVVAACWYWS